MSLVPVSPLSRDTKPCPKCEDTAVFRDRVLRIGAQSHQHLVAQSEFVAAWKCENPDCDYFERFVSS